jgi:aspartyl-tRNA(Asn)/glutamyl-tRNA(Gln) amidotransferase subunit C
MSDMVEEIKRVASLARLTLTTDDISLYAPQLSRILELVAQMDKVKTETVEPLAHPLEIGQRLRPDKVTEIDQRSKFQAIAPSVDAGLYLVPKVIDEA